MTASEMVEVDRLMIDEIGITLIQMMENAGRSLARLALLRFGPRRVLVLAGSGGNGGGGLVAARHLHNAGVEVAVLLSGPPENLSGVIRHQFEAIERMSVPIVQRPVDHGVDLVIDAVIGYSLGGAPRGKAADLIDWANGEEVDVLSLDNPSGLDVTSGEQPGLAVRATATLTLALPKQGLRSSPLVGELYLADISVPSIVYERLGLGPVPSFRSSPILRVADDERAPLPHPVL